MKEIKNLYQVIAMVYKTVSQSNPTLERGNDWCRHKCDVDGDCIPERPIYGGEPVLPEPGEDVDPSDPYANQRYCVSCHHCKKYWEELFHIEREGGGSNVYRPGQLTSGGMCAMSINRLIGWLRNRPDMKACAGCLKERPGDDWGLRGDSDDWDNKKSNYNECIRNLANNIKRVCRGFTGDDRTDWHALCPACKFCEGACCSEDGCEMTTGGKCGSEHGWQGALSTCEHGDCDDWEQGCGEGPLCEEGQHCCNGICQEEPCVDTGPDEPDDGHCCMGGVDVPAWPNETTCELNGGYWLGKLIRCSLHVPPPKV